MLEALDGVTNLNEAGIKAPLVSLFFFFLSISGKLYMTGEK